MRKKFDVKILKGLGMGLIVAVIIQGATIGLSAIVASRENAQAAASQKDSNSEPMSAQTGNTNVGAPQLVATGHDLFAQACSSCHGQNAQGGYAPNLHKMNLPDAKVADVIRNGVKGKMPAFGDKYSATQQQALVAYVQSLKPHS
jgi:mono/diheme cytochrome c family protein